VPYETLRPKSSRGETMIGLVKAFLEVQSGVLRLGAAISDLQDQSFGDDK
jgi:hypothetical protein